MKKVIIKWSRHLLLPSWLAKLVILYWKPLDDMLEYDPGVVDWQWSKVKNLFYISSDWIRIDNSIETVYWNEQKAREVRTETENKKIGEIMRIKGYKVKDFENMQEWLNKNIELIENKDKELEELKNQNNTLFFNNSNLGKENRELREENEVLKTKLNKKK